jgi:hypothetical protein
LKGLSCGDDWLGPQQKLSRITNSRSEDEWVCGNTGGESVFRLYLRCYSL